MAYEINNVLLLMVIGLITSFSIYMPYTASFEPASSTYTNKHIMYLLFL